MSSLSPLRLSGPSVASANLGSQHLAGTARGAAFFVGLVLTAALLSAAGGVGERSPERHLPVGSVSASADRTDLSTVRRGEPQLAAGALPLIR